MNTPSLLIKNISYLATMDKDQNEYSNVSVFCKSGKIEKIGSNLVLEDKVDNIIDGTDKVVIPGLVNTHHHLFQNLTRVYKPAQNSSLFGWLTSLYPVWQNIIPSDIYISSLIGMSEMVLTGCTTTSDHLYLFPNGSKLEDQIEAAKLVGCRFHAARGFMSVGESKGGLPPDSLTEDEDFIIKDCQRVVEEFNNPDALSMLRVVIAPCSPFSVSQDLMKISAEMARDYNITLHTHLAENDEDIEYSIKKFNKSPGEYAQDLGWLGDDVWHAHCVKLNQSESKLFSKTCTGIAHCPTSNMRLASGIAPVRDWVDLGVKVGLGVDGSSSNDSGHLLAEARQTMLLQRVKYGAEKFSAREALKIATKGGAETLNRNDIGEISIGKAADFAIYDLNQIDMSGTFSDPIAGLIFCGPIKTKFTICNGNIIAENGHMKNFDLNISLENHKTASKRLLNI